MHFWICQNVVPSSDESLHVCEDSWPERFSIDWTFKENKHIYITHCVINQSCESYFSGGQLRHRAVTLNHRTPLSGSQTLLPTDTHSPCSSQTATPTTACCCPPLPSAAQTHWQNTKTIDASSQLPPCSALATETQSQCTAAWFHVWSQEINAIHEQDHLSNILRCHSKVDHNEYNDYEKLNRQQQQYYMRDDND